MPWNELLLPILAGYIFTNVLYLTRFRAQRLDGYRLIIESLFFGIVIFTAARFASMWIHGTAFGNKAEHLIAETGLAYPFLGTGILAGLCAAALALLGNIVIGADRAKSILVAQHDNGFMRLFQKAAMESRMVSITLSSKKVYIGYIVSTPNLSPEEQFVGILPVVSGYRDKDTLELVTTTDYGNAISSGTFSPEDFEIAVALGSIESANLFDPDIYPLFSDVKPEETSLS